MLEVYLEYGQSISPFDFSSHKFEKPYHFLFSAVGFRLSTWFWLTQLITWDKKSTGRRTPQVSGVRNHSVFYPATEPGWALWTQICFIYHTMWLPSVLVQCMHYPSDLWPWISCCSAGVLLLLKAITCPLFPSLESTPNSFLAIGCVLLRTG